MKEFLLLVLIVISTVQLSHAQPLEFVLVDIAKTPNTLAVEGQLRKWYENRNVETPFVVFVCNGQSSFVAKDQETFEKILKKFNTIQPILPNPVDVIGMSTDILTNYAIDLDSLSIHYFASSVSVFNQNHIKELLERFLVVLGYNLASQKPNVTIYLDERADYFNEEQLIKMKSNYPYNYSTY